MSPALAKMVAHVWRRAYANVRNGGLDMTALYQVRKFDCCYAILTNLCTFLHSL